MLLTHNNHTRFYFQRLTVWLVILAACLCFVAFSMADKLSENDLTSRIEGVHAQNISTAHVVEESIRQMLAQADAILLMMKLDMEKYGYMESQHEELLKMYLALPAIDQIAVADAKGNLTFSAVPLEAPLNIAIREHFQAQVNQDRQLYIAAPWISRATGKQSIYLSRRVNDHNGNFAGVVAIGLKQQHMSSVFDRLELGEGSTIVLLRRDGSFMARIPDTLSFDAMTNHFRTHITVERVARGEMSGNFETSTTIDGIIRFGAFRALPDYPLVVLATMPKARVLHEARQESSYYWFMALLFSVIVLIAFFVIWLQLRKQIKTTDELHRSENRLRVITESAQEAIIMIDNQGNISFWNPAAETILGYNAAEAIGKNMHQLITPKRYHEAHQAGFAHFQHTGQGPVVGTTLELSACHKNGSEITVELALSAIQSPEGWQAAGILRDISERKSLEAEILHLATHDDLTGLPSKRLADDRLETAIATARRHKTKLAVLFLDIDGFKEVNDTYGHGSGDMVLKRVADAVRLIVRDTDTVARVGGDEFWVIAPDLHSKEEAALIARKIVRVISQPLSFAGGQAKVGASVGIAVYPDDSEDSEQLIKLADQAMYEVKRSGKNGYAFANKIDSVLLS